ncbi:hypothetical protein [uncultured Thiodictyon sp.]|uniref:hypothetical protein n=1 Tax=uncultured Thiodictyon sp. TaxID=1846217 RepID=UPI0025F4795B|nr:hypothetical protein [uncultured Thiodictyon sp.]
MRRVRDGVSGRGGDRESLLADPGMGGASVDKDHRQLEGQGGAHRLQGAAGQPRLVRVGGGDQDVRVAQQERRLGGVGLGAACGGHWGVGARLGMEPVEREDVGATLRLRIELGAKPVRAAVTIVDQVEGQHRGQFGLQAAGRFARRGEVREHLGRQRIGALTQSGDQPQQRRLRGVALRHPRRALRRRRDARCQGHEPLAHDGKDAAQGQAQVCFGRGREFAAPRESQAQHGARARRQRFRGIGARRAARGLVIILPVGGTGGHYPARGVIKTPGGGESRRYVIATPSSTI